VHLKHNGAFLYSSKIFSRYASPAILRQTSIALQYRKPLVLIQNMVPGIDRLEVLLRLKTNTLINLALLSALHGINNCWYWYVNTSGQLTSRCRRWERA
jgi:hypothetical protein